jgi:hypothetical protein
MTLPEKKKPKAKTKRKCPLYLGKETYGDIPIEEAFKKALEPYFNPDKDNLYVS